MLSSVMSLLKFCVLLSLFLPQSKKKVFISLNPQKPKHRQYPSSSAVSLVTVLREWTENVWACVWVCRVNECVWAGGCAQAVYAHAKDLSFLFVSAMQVQKKSEAFWLLLFPGRVTLFFQIRALTGFWFCILKWFKSGSAFLVTVFSIWIRRIGSLTTEAKTEKAHMGEQNKAWWNGYKTSCD